MMLLNSVHININVQQLTSSGAATTDFDEGKLCSLYTEGLQFEDSFECRSTVYQIGDVVTYGGYSYVYKNTNEQCR
jgi:hypothetical protein